MIEQLLGFAITALVGSVVIPPIAKFLQSKVTLFLKTGKVSIQKAVLARIKDKDTYEMIKAMILNAESTLGSAQGVAKFEMVKAKILKAVPDMFDPLASAIIQSVYDVMKEKSEI